MSVAGFIKELLSEDMYDNAFNERINERISKLNAAQLQGMYNYLQNTAKSSKSAMWNSVNLEIISKMEGKMKEKDEIEKKKRAEREDRKLKAKHATVMENEARREKKRVLKMIIDTALKEAEEEVREEENKRHQEEKVIIMKKTFIAEEKRNKWWKITAGCYLVAFIIVCVVVKIIVILIGCLFGITLIAAGVAYYAHRFTNIPPEVIEPDVLQERIKAKQDIHKKEKLSILVDKELHYQQQVRKDKKEKKKRIADRKAKQLLEAQLLETRRLEQIAMAKQAIAKKNKLDGLSASGKVLPVSTKSKKANFNNLEVLSDLSGEEKLSDIEENKSEEGHIEESHEINDGPELHSDEDEEPLPTASDIENQLKDLSESELDRRIEALTNIESREEEEEKEEIVSSIKLKPISNKIKSSKSAILPIQTDGNIELFKANDEHHDDLIVQSLEMV